MSILVNRDTKVLVQGLTGKNGTLHTEHALRDGTQVVGGVTPGKGGTQHLGLPIFDSMKEAVHVTQAHASVIYVPAPCVLDCIVEAVDAGIRLIVVITEGVPTLDILKAKHYVKEASNVCMIGPNCPGVITPGQCKIGVMPSHIHKPGTIGVVSRSGTLAYEAVAQITQLGLGQSTCVGIGGDPILGTSFTDILALFQEDQETEAVVMIGEIGGRAEEAAADYIQAHMTKPIVGYIAGTTAPKGKRMGHAGAIVSGGEGMGETKLKVLEKAGVICTKNPATIGTTLYELL